MQKEGGMVRSVMASLLGVLTLTALASAAPPQLRWTTGQTLVYKAEQVTQAVETLGDDKSETRSRLNLGKRWQVVAVDANGIATLQLTLTSMRLETVTPSGTTMLFDSTAPDKSTPAMRDQLSKFVGAPLAVLRVDGYGRVLEVKESKFGSASRYEVEPPFGGVLPGALPQVGQGWDRTYQITLEPPQGTGEKFAAVQHYACKAVTPAALTVGVTTEVKNLPAAPGDQVPLLQLQPQGEIVYDLQNGRLQKANLVIDRTLANHQGEGSNYRLVSSYVEEYVGDR
jgi:hypothetical protein